MGRVLRDLLRSNHEFAIGIALLAIVVVMAALSAFSPYPPNDTYLVPPDIPPSWTYPLGTTSRGQDVFWLLTFAIRNSLLFGVLVALLSRCLSLLIGLTAGYAGGMVDRVLMSINDTFIVIPLFPILVLFYFVMRDHMSWILLALVMAGLGWAYDARLIRSVALSLRTREFTETAIFSGMTARQILLQEHLPYVLPIVFSTTMNNINWSIGLEVTLSVLGFTDINTPTIGVMIYWANQHTALVAGIWWWIAFPVTLVVMTFIGLFLLAVSMNEYIDPPQPVEQVQRMNILTVSHLRAYYVTQAFGLQREVRAVDDVSLSVARNEIYGLAGESSCGKSTLIKTIAAAVHPPLRVVDGTVTFNFTGQPIDMRTAASSDIDGIRWRHLSYIVQGSMSVLNPLRRVRQTFIDFALRHIAKPMPEFLAVVRAHLQRLHLAPEVLEAYPHELSGGMRQRVTIALATVCRPDFIIADEPTTALDVVVQRDVLAMIREIQREIGSSLLFVTHDLAVHANLCDRLGVMYAGRLVEEGPTAELLHAPHHPYTAHLVASLPRIGDATPKISLPGAPPNLAEPPTGCRFHPRCPLAMDICRREVPPMRPDGAGRRVACFAVQ